MAVEAIGLWLLRKMADFGWGWAMKRFASAVEADRTALRTFATTYVLKHTGMMGGPDATEVRAAVERYFGDTKRSLYPEWERDVALILAENPPRGSS